MKPCVALGEWWDVRVRYRELHRVLDSCRAGLLGRLGSDAEEGVRDSGRDRMSDEGAPMRSPAARGGGGATIRMGSRVRHVDGHADLPDGTVVALPPASERVAVVQPHAAGQSPYLCPVGHLVALDLDVELLEAVRRLMRLDHRGRCVGTVALPVKSAGISGDPDWRRTGGGCFVGTGFLPPLW